MSRWRNITMGALPDFKRLVELAETPEEMWISLALEYIGAAESEPPDFSKQKAILNFVTEVQYLHADSYLGQGNQEFKAIKTAGEVMPSWRKFLVENARSDRFFLELWNQFFSIAIHQIWNVSPSERQKMSEAFAFADLCAGPWLRTRHSASVGHFTRAFVEQFTFGDLDRAQFFENFITETSFEDWMVRSDLDKHLAAKAWTTYWATRNVKWPR